MNRPQCSKPLLVFSFTIRRQFLSLKINSSKEISERFLELIWLLAAHKPHKYIDAVLHASEMCSYRSSGLPKFHQLLFVVLGNLNHELDICWLLALSHRVEHGLLGLQHVKVEVDTLEKVLIFDVLVRAVQKGLDVFEALFLEEWDKRCTPSRC